jgi:hypothetical protein
MELFPQRMRAITAQANEGKISQQNIEVLLGVLKKSTAWDRCPDEARRMYAALMSAKRSKEGKKRVKAFTPEERAAMRRAAR